jgi:hypothetical protein
MSAKAKEDGSVNPKVQIRLMSMKKLRSNTINKRVDMSKVKHPELVLCIIV